MKTQKAANAPGDVSLEPVRAQVQRSQEREVSNSRGEVAGEPVGGQTQRHHPAAAACHTLPAAEAGAAVPRGEHVGAVACEIGLESEQRTGLVAAAVNYSPGGHCDHGENGRRQQSHGLHCRHEQVVWFGV